MMILGNIFRTRVHKDTCWSTSDVLKSLIIPGNQTDANKGCYVTAEFQTHGRGLGSNTWHSSRKSNLLLSFQATPENIIPANQFVISRIIALSLSDVLTRLLPHHHIVKIKWPNDLYTDDKKIAGILVENQIMGDKILSSIIGIGFNINESDFPPEIPNPVSLAQLIHQQTDIEIFLQLLINAIETRSRIDKSSFNSLHKQYDEHLFGLNEQRYFRDQNGEFTGTVIGTDPIGQLRVSAKDRIRHYGFKEVEFLI